jgi:hypothetical protein
LKGEQIATDASWYATLLNSEFIHAETGGFFSPELSPNEYKLPTKRQDAVAAEEVNGGTLYDFGKETFGFICLDGTNGKGKVTLYWGESRAEALDFDECEVFDTLELASGRTESKIARAFRYVTVVCEEGAAYKSLYELFEYRPFSKRATFSSDDKLLTDIWNVALDTFSLATREFFYDGIKRDRWVWSGDAFQSGFLNRYSFYDKAVWKNTIMALAGKGKIACHMNTIIDYTMYWLIGFYDYYIHTGDREFVVNWYPRYREWLDFLLAQTNEQGFLIHKPTDWVFIDWSDYLEKDCEVYSFLQILLYGTLCAASKVAKVAGDEKESARFDDMANKLIRLIDDTFWVEEKGGYAYGLKDGKCDGRIFRQQNVMAIFVGLAQGERRQTILERVLKNPDIPAISTPYMRFYELTVLAELNEIEYVLSEMKEYFGGMLSLGATSFWEAYDKTQSGNEHYAMYGRKYGKSLCHAWGATPLWIVGRYLLGVEENVEEGKLSISPYAGLKGDISAKIPLSEGMVSIEKQGFVWSFLSDRSGEVHINGKVYALHANQILKI